MRSEHFTVTYPAPLTELAQRAATYAERAYSQLSNRFRSAPDGKIELLLTDHADLANGFATPFPYNQITIFARPPMDGGSISYFDDWLELVITHELVHTFHLDMEGTALGKLLRTVFGRVPVSWPAFPSASSPTWVTEGLATYFESALTGAGRVRGSWQEMILRTAIMEGSFSTLDQLSGHSPVWPSGNRPYVYGARYLDFVANRYGEAALASFATSVAGLWVPYRMNAAARKSFGLSVADSWELWRQELESEYATLATVLSESAPITQGEAVDSTGRITQQAVVSPAGVLAFSRSDGVSQAQIRIAAEDGTRASNLTRINGTDGTLSWGPGGDLYFTQLEFNDRYRITSDLYRVRFGGTAERLTHGLRITAADVSADGTLAVGVQESGGTGRLIVLDLATGLVTPLVSPDPDVHWAFPRWSPDGSKIVAVRWERPAQMDIVVLDRNGETIAEITRDRAIDTTPFWAPDGTTIIWASDRTGIPNLFVATLPTSSVSQSRPSRTTATPATGELQTTFNIRQVTNMLGGAAHPSVDPTGQWIYFSSYHSDGWHLERTPFRPDTWFSPQPVSARFAEEASAPPSLPAATLDPQPYRPFSTLLPRYWLPQFRVADRGLATNGRWYNVIEPTVGLQVTGEDLVGRHSYSILGHLSLDADHFNGAFGYNYRRLGNPVLGLTLSQSHDASSRSVAVQLGDGSTVEYFLLERERQALLSASFLRRRFRSALSFTLTGGLIREDLTLRDLAGAAGPTLIRPRPKNTFTQLRTTVAASNIQRRAFSISREDGMAFWLSGRWRHQTGLLQEERDALGIDRSFREITGELSAFKSLRLFGFANHVAALRISAGVGFGPGANQSHFGVGGAEGMTERVTNLGLFGGEPRLFPVRGYGEDVRVGRIAWSGSAEYRFPIALVDRGLGSFPLFIDRISGSLFFDAGNAWGPTLGERGYENPKQSGLTSAGAELSAILAPGFGPGITLRAGFGMPLEDGAGAVWYLRIGNAF